MRAAVTYLLGRLGQSVLVVVGAVLIAFVLVNVSGSAAISAGGGLLTEAQVREIERELGYDRPLVPRFLEYIGDVFTGHFGNSYRFGESAASVVLEALPNTLLLVAGALIVSIGIGGAIAIVSVLKRDTRTDHLLRRGASLAQGVPEFWLALMLVLVFSVSLDWLPSIGFDSAQSLVLPVVALSVPLVPAVQRLLRGQLLDVMAQDFVVALRSKGLSERAIVWRHALRNALPGFITYLALQVGWLIGGTVVVEAVFQWPGVGSLVLSAVQARDLVVIQTVVIFVALCFVALNLLADLFVLWLDPRVRTGRL